MASGVLPALRFQSAFLGGGDDVLDVHGLPGVREDLGCGVQARHRAVGQTAFVTPSAARGVDNAPSWSLARLCELAIHTMIEARVKGCVRCEGLTGFDGCARRKVLPPINIIKLTITTFNDAGAGTDDDVYLGICGREFNVNKDSDLFKQGNTDTFTFGGASADVFNPDENDPQKFLLLNTDNLDLFPVWLRAVPNGKWTDWHVKSVTVTVNPGPNQHVFGGVPPGQSIWIGASPRSDFPTGGFLFLRRTAGTPTGPSCLLLNADNPTFQTTSITKSNVNNVVAFSVANAAGDGVRGQGTKAGVAGVSGGGLGVSGTANIGTGAQGSSTSGTGVKGDSGTGNGVHGASTRGGFGVLGESKGSVGVAGKSDSGAGVSGISGRGVGVRGASTFAFGVDGFSTKAAGVHGRSSAVAGVFGETSAIVGVEGAANSGAGVFGHATSGIGVRALSNSGSAVDARSNSGIGVQGIANTNYGVQGTATSGVGVGGKSTSGVGVQGSSSTKSGVDGASNSGAGVSGKSATGSGVQGASTSDSGVNGISISGPGVNGASTSGPGMKGRSTRSVGVAGVSNKTHGIDGQCVGAPAGGIGVYGLANNSAGTPIGVYGKSASTKGFGGAFEGRVAVAGDFFATGFNAVAVPFGVTQKLLYSAAAPQPWVEEFGRSQLVNGMATVTIPADLLPLIATGSGNYFVFLTARGDCLGLFVASQAAGSFVVRELQGGTSNAKFAYHIVARRKDIPGVRLQGVPLPQPV